MPGQSLRKDELSSRMAEESLTMAGRNIMTELLSFRTAGRSIMMV